VKSSPERILTICGSTEHHRLPAQLQGLVGSGRQSAATLAPAGGQDGAAGASPHPVAETMGTAAAPVTRLKGALAHGFTPTFVRVFWVCARKTGAQWT
jgi:hypothetical protein